MTAPSTPVTFRNRQGQQLFGILHHPARPQGHRPAILLLSPGVKMRVAPHRLYLKMAERFVALGYPVLRFDFHGLGDAEGEAGEKYLADLYGATQAGRYVGDTIAAMDWMASTYGTQQFIAAGLCGGALTGLLAAERDTRITALVALSIPVILDGAAIDATKFMTDAQLEGIGRGYVKKLTLSHADGWRAWARLLTFRSEYRLIVRAVLRPWLGKLRRQDVAADAATAPITDNTNPLFAPAFRRVVASSRRVLLVFAECDRLYAEFEEKFVKRHQLSLEPYRPYFDVHVTPRANHIFSMPEWHEDALQQCCAWLSQASAGSARPAVALAAR